MLLSRQKKCFSEALWPVEHVGAGFLTKFDLVIINTLRERERCPGGKGCYPMSCAKGRRVPQFNYVKVFELVILDTDRWLSSWRYTYIFVYRKGQPIFWQSMKRSFVYTPKLRTRYTLEIRDMCCSFCRSQAHGVLCTRFKCCICKDHSNIMI
jgi:hypothetical protein